MFVLVLPMNRRAIAFHFLMDRVTKPERKTEQALM